MFKSILLATALTTTLAGAAFAQADPGSYLAARQADFGNDYEAAARYYQQAVLADPSNPMLLEGTMAANLSLGNLDAAAPIADAMISLGIESQVANIVRSVQAGRTGNWVQIFEALEQDHSVGPLVDGLSQAWAHMGLGEVNKALMTFDEVIEAPGLRAYGLFHKAMALASVGDYEGAEEILSLSPEGGVRHNRRSAIALAQILSQLDRNSDAVALIDAVFGDRLDTRLIQMRAALEAGDTLPYDTVRSAADGLAEVYFMVGGALRGETPDGYTLLYVRAAQALRPNDTEILLTAANLLDDLGRYEMSNAAYAQVSPDDPAYMEAEIGRADALRKADRLEASIEVLQALSRLFPEEARIYATKGDVLRRMDKEAEANAAYTTALDLYAPDDPAIWFVRYTRAITYFMLDQWPEAEADFRAALAIRPEQPQVLNFLGYSLVERGEKLPEALDMIERAVAAQPDNGAIVDSLGWVYFQLGRYQDAVAPMERAASLEPVDPVINDHLGDVYWAVGREIEAQFQWNRALSFDPEEEEAIRIRRKLEVGLDAVLIEEGEDPIRVASDD
ncbi:tetratricopeptide repeat protein [Yoonia sp. 208BN28-4]|uniref:tetratricopeptide repeat protein n=1 Tax=Yoonia sp. 208BN28-4 TaxID=3126505 RepID=UPI0030AAF713